MLALAFLLTLSQSAIAAELTAEDVPAVVYIYKVDFKGNERFSREALISSVKITEGRSYPRAVLAETVKDDLRRLYRLGYFLSVNAEYAQDANGATITFVVDERPQLTDVRISGNRAISKEDIRKELTSKKGDTLNPVVMQHDLNKIYDMYEKKGFIFAEISPQIEKQDKGSILIYKINEGKKVTIDRVDVVGNTAISDWTIRNKLIKSKEATLFDSKAPDEQQLLDDARSIEKAYRNRGYIKASVETPEVTYDKDKKSARLTFKVTEGRKYRVGAITLEGYHLFPLEDLQREMVLSRGDIYNEKVLEQSVSNIYKRYYNMGRLFAGVNHYDTTSDINNTVDIRILISEGNPVRVQFIDFVGNESTQDRVLRRELSLLPGQIYNQDRLNRGLQRIFNLGFLDEVGQDIQVRSDMEDAVDLIIKVKEKSGVAKFNLGTSYSQLDGLMGTFGITFLNFDAAQLPYVWKCKGASQTVDLNIEYGKNRSRYNIGFTEPYIADTPTSISFNVYRTDIFRTIYHQLKTGGSVGVGRMLSEYVVARTGFAMERVDLDIQANVPLERMPGWVVEDEGRHDTNTFSLGLTRDSRDNVFYPHKGSRHSVSGEIAGGIFQGDNDFYRVTVSDAVFFKPVWSIILALRNTVGYVQRYGRSDAVPLYERFFIGGADTVRGYDEQSLGPRDGYGNVLGGRATEYANLELRLPIDERIFRFLLFYDVGNSWEDIYYMNFRDLKSGVGAGVRVDIPSMGLIGFDYGYGIARRTGQLHFSFGSTF